MPTAAQNLGAQLLEKQAWLQKFFKDHETKEADRPYAMSFEEIEQVRTKNAELDDLGKKWEEARELEDILVKNEELGKELARPRRTLALGQLEPEVKSFGSAVVDAMALKDGKPPLEKEFEIKDWGPDEFKTTMTTAAGMSPPIIRSGHVELTLQRKIMIPDILPTINLSLGNAYTYMRETVFTNSAATIAEAAAYPESALQYAEVTENVRKIGTFIPVTDEQLMDVEGMRQLIDSRLRLMATLVLETQLLSGNGTPPNLNGFYNQVTQTQAKGTDPVFDAIFKAMVLVQTVGLANPDAVVLHPLDFQDIRLTRTADGIYIMGNPDQVGLDRIFGARTVVSLAATQNTGLVGDFSTYSAMIQRLGVEVLVGMYNDQFIKDLQTLKVRLRAGLVIFRLSAFATVTGI